MTIDGFLLNPTQVDQRTEGSRGEGTSSANAAIEQPDFGNDERQTLSGVGKEWRFAQRPRSPRSRIKNVNVNLNVNAAGRPRKVDIARASPDHHPLASETVNCSEPHNANDRYSSSFLANSSVQVMNVGDDFQVAGEAGTRKTSSVHVGEDITLCWIETTTIKEDRGSHPIQRLVIREYTISFENSATIPERYLECVKLEGEVDWRNSTVPKSALFEVVDENTRHSRVVNFTTVSHSDELTVWQHRRVRCGVGPVVTKNIIEWADERSDNPKKRVEIKVSPKIHRLSAQPTDTEPCTTDTFESRPTSTTPRQRVAKVCGPGTTCESYSDCVDDSCGYYSSINQSHPDLISPGGGRDENYATVSNLEDVDASVAATTERSGELESNDILSTGVTKGSSLVTSDTTESILETTAPDSVVIGTEGTILRVTLPPNSEADSVEAGDQRTAPSSDSDESYFSTSESKDSSELCEGGESCGSRVSSEGSFIYSSEEGTTVVDSEIADSATRRDSAAADIEESSTVGTTDRSLTILYDTDATTQDRDGYVSREEWSTTVGIPRRTDDTETAMPTRIVGSGTTASQSTGGGIGRTVPPILDNDTITETRDNDTGFARSSEDNDTTTEMIESRATGSEWTESFSGSAIAETRTESDEKFTEKTRGGAQSTEGGNEITESMRNHSGDTESAENSGTVTEATERETTKQATRVNDGVFAGSTDSMTETISEMPEGSDATTEASKISIGRAQPTECHPGSGDCEASSDGGTTEQSSESAIQVTETERTNFPKTDNATSTTEAYETTDSVTDTNREGEKTTTGSDETVPSTEKASATQSITEDAKTLSNADSTSEVPVTKNTVTDGDLTTSREGEVKNPSIPWHPLDEVVCDEGGNSAICRSRSDEPVVTTEPGETKARESSEGTGTSFGTPDFPLNKDRGIDGFTTVVAETTTKESSTPDKEEIERDSTVEYNRDVTSDTSPMAVESTEDVVTNDSTNDNEGKATQKAVPSSQTDITEYFRQNIGNGVTEAVSTAPLNEDTLADNLEEGSTDSLETVTGSPVTEYSTTEIGLTAEDTEGPSIEDSTTPSVEERTEETFEDYFPSTPGTGIVEETEEPFIPDYSTTPKTVTDGETEGPATEYLTTPSFEIEGTTEEPIDGPSETTPRPCDPDSESCESKEESADVSCDEDTGNCAGDSFLTTPCDEDSGSCSTDSAMSFSVSTCDEDSGDCGTDSTLVSATICDENSSASCTSPVEADQYEMSSDSLEACENSPTGTCRVTPQTRESNGLATTSSTPIEVENIPTTVNDVPTTVESRRSTTVKAVSTDSTSDHKLALKIRILLEHIDENKKRQKLVEVDKHLLFNEHPDEHGKYTLMKQVRSLNNSVNMQTVQALFNCSAVEKLTGDVSEFAAKYLAKHSGLEKAEEPGGNVSESVEEVHARKPRDLSSLEKSEANKNLEISLPGIHADIHAGFDHVMSRLPSEDEAEKRSSGVTEEEIPRSRMFKVVADPQDERAYTRRKRESIEDLTIEKEDLPEDVEEVGHWSNERVRRTINGSHVRTLTEFTIYEGP